MFIHYRNYFNSRHMKKITLITILLLSSAFAFCTTWTINNVSFAFNPSSITIVTGDGVNFVLGSIHNAAEVSQVTWNANGNAPLPGGFSVPFGGGAVLPAKLTVGTHWYVCEPHASSGMKGIIIVSNTTGINDINSQENYSVYPNPASDLIQLKANLNSPGTDYFLTDMGGRQIITGKLNGESTNIDISSLRRGIYLLQVNGIKGRAIRVLKN
jgi:plastocyanin